MEGKCISDFSSPPTLYTETTFMKLSKELCKLFRLIGILGCTERNVFLKNYFLDVKTL